MFVDDSKRSPSQTLWLYTYFVHFCEDFSKNIEIELSNRNKKIIFYSIIGFRSLQECAQP